MYKFKSKLSSQLLNGLTVLWAVVLLLPICWVISTATKHATDAYALPPVWIYTPVMNNFRTVLGSALFSSGFFNSCVIAVITTSLSLLFGIPAGYSLARNTTSGSKMMGFWIVLSRMLPAMGFAIPYYFIFKYLGISDTYFSVILIYLTSMLPFSVWMLMGYIKGLPMEIEEAAMIDGCSRVRTLISIIIPVAKPGIATCAIFTFMYSWNEFFYAVIMTSRRTRTVSIAIVSFVGETGTNWGELCAAALLVALPMILFTLFSQKSLIRGLTNGAVKG